MAERLQIGRVGSIGEFGSGRDCGEGCRLYTIIGLDCSILEDKSSKLGKSVISGDDETRVGNKY